MKLLILITLFISQFAFAAECRITGVLHDKKEIETSFELADPESCLNMADKARETNFFGMVEKASKLESAEASFEPNDESNL